MKILIDNKSGLPIYDQIYTQIKAQIMSGALKEDEALPALYQVGEDINRLLFNWLGEDMQYTNQTEFSAKLLCLWGAVYGIITLAENRKDYIQNGLGVPKEEFLASAFECVYQSIDWKEGC